MSKKKLLADPSTESYDPTGNWFRALKVSKKQVSITTYKVLLSKLLYTGEIFTEEDEVLLFLCHERCVELLAQPEFHKRYFWLIWINRNIFSGLSAFVKNSTAKSDHREMLDSYFSHGRSQLNAYIYYGALNKTSLVKMQSREPQKLKPRNRIGVGYRDKGNARNSAVDGSPSWQEVALDEWFQGHSLGSSIASKISKLWEDFRVGEFFVWNRVKHRSREPSNLCLQMRG